MGQKKVLLFHLSPNTRNQIQKLCRRLGISAVSVEDSRMGEQIGVLAGIKGFKRNADAKAKAIPAEMLVFSGMDSSDVDQFLSEYQASGIAPIACKAIVTPDNIFWTAEQLCQELLKEHYRI